MPFFQVCHQSLALVAQAGTRGGTVAKDDQDIAAQVRDAERVFGGFVQEFPYRAFQHFQLADPVKQVFERAGLIAQLAMQ